MFSHMHRAEFEEWWKTFPRKVGKIAAEKAYLKARKRASASELLIGVARYVQHKPTWQEYAHPTSWLNQGRWADDYDTPAPTEAPSKRVPEAYRAYVPLRLRDEQAGNG